MTGMENPKQTSRVKRWLITIGIFLIVQLIFIAVDGTSLEPNINDGGSLLARTGRAVLESRLFTEWITPYSFAFFNLFITVQVIAILIQAVMDMRATVISNK